MEMTGKSEEARQEEVLICPLLSLRPQTLDDSVRRLVSAAVPNACIRAQCAWWDEESGKCAVVMIGRAAKSLYQEAAER